MTIAVQPKLPNIVSPRLIVGGGAVLIAILLFALTRRLASGAMLFPTVHGLWLTLHLASVIPAIPLGAYVLARRKGDVMHKRLGRIWAMLMVGAALSSFGLSGLTGGLSPIHLLSILVLVSLPRAIWNARRGNIAAHRTSMTILYLSLLIAGFFTFLPGRVFGIWLFG